MPKSGVWDGSAATVSGCKVVSLLHTDQAANDDVGDEKLEAVIGVSYP